jgi:hypothetical protein
MPSVELPSLWILPKIVVDLFCDQAQLALLAMS